MTLALIRKGVFGLLLLLTIAGLVPSKASQAPASGSPPSTDIRATVDQLVTSLSRGFPQETIRIAVADFPDLRGVTSDLGRFVATRITTRLAESGKYAVVERQRLNQILLELKFSLSDLADPSKAQRLGQLAGAEALVVGTISDLGDSVDFDARLIEVSTARTRAGATATLRKTDFVTTMLRGSAESIDEPSRGNGEILLSGATRWTSDRPGYRIGGPESPVVTIVAVDLRATATAIRLKVVGTRVGYLGQPENEHVPYFVDNLGKKYMMQRHTGSFPSSGSLCGSRSSTTRCRELVNGEAYSYDLIFPAFDPKASSITLTLDSFSAAVSLRN
jgi:hypothetical protein